MLLTSFTGNIYNEALSRYTADEVKYQVYFLSNNEASSESQWFTEETSVEGQYNFNLGDEAYLGSEGRINNGDRVLILFWTPNTETKTSSSLIEWSFLDIVITNSFIYYNDVETRTRQGPNPVYDISSDNTVGSTITLTNDGSTDLGTWGFNGNTIKQGNEIYGVSLFTGMNTLVGATVDIDWGDSSTDEDIAYDSNSITHVYTSSDDFTITITLTNDESNSNNQIIEKRIYWNAPEIDFEFSHESLEPAGVNGLGEVLTLTNITTDPDSRASTDSWTCTWEIEDNDEYGNFTNTIGPVSFTNSPTYQFKNPGQRNVNLIVNWYDGFDFQELQLDKNITQNIWVVTNGLNWNLPISLTTSTALTPNITGDVDRVIGVDYSVNSVSFATDRFYNDTVYYNFTSVAAYTITQDIVFHTGFEEIEISQNFTLRVEPKVSYTIETTSSSLTNIYTAVVTALAGSLNYHWKVYDEEDNIVNQLSGDDKTEFRYSWPSNGVFRIELSVTDTYGLTGTYYQDFTITDWPGTSRIVYYGGYTKEYPKIKVVEKVVEKPVDKIIYQDKIVYKEKPKPNVRLKSNMTETSNPIKIKAKKILSEEENNITISLKNFEEKNISNIKKPKIVLKEIKE